MYRIKWIIILVFLLIFYLPSPGWTNYTNSNYVTLQITAQDQGNGMGPGAEMKFSNNGQDWSSPEPFATIRNLWDLTAFGGGTSDGQKTVYLKLKDTSGNWSINQITASIVLDQTAPAVNAAPAGGNYDKPISITLTANESAAIYYTTDGSTPTSLSKIYSAPITLNQTVTLKFFAEDMAGNQSPIFSQTYNILDLTLDTDNDGMPDWWEKEYGLAPNQNDANLDNDLDGYTNLEEYLAGWNPVHYASTIYVNANAPAGGNGAAGAPLNSIYQALQIAIDADTVLVLEGNYLESQGLIIKDRVDLTSDVGAKCTIDLDGSGYIEAGDYSTILGFTIINPLDNTATINCIGTSPGIYNNIIVPKTASATAIRLSDSSSAKVINNTIVDAYVGIEIDSASPVIKNNIIVNNLVGIMLYSGNPLIDYNNVWGNIGNATCPNGDYCGGVMAGLNDMSSDPMFVDKTLANYHLLTDSPCIDMGTAQDAPTDDIDGNLRPQGAGYDMGADEVVNAQNLLPVVELSMNKAFFVTGEKIVVYLDITAPDIPIKADLYITLQFPDGRSYYYPNWSIFPKAILRSWTISDLSKKLFTRTFRGTEIAGKYTWSVYLVQPKTDILIVPPTTASFTYVR
jgi:hypothetical protein